MSDVSRAMYNLVNADRRMGGWHTCEIDGVVFTINPSSYQCVTERLHVDAPTRAGFVRFAYGAKPPVYTLEGFTGSAGVPGIDAMERFRPLVGRPERIVTFKYPNRFRDVRKVYVNRFEDSISSDTHLYNSYAIELVEYGDQDPASVVKLAQSAAQSLQIALVPGGGGGAVLVTPTSPIPSNPEHNKD